MTWRDRLMGWVRTVEVVVNARGLQQAVWRLASIRQTLQQLFQFSH